ncbi:MAG: zinc ribbon domain-containing protein [Vulcanimicrobiaceae bacterium]
MEYKAILHSRMLVVAPRFYPSSKICSVCRHLNKHITFADANWTCRCGARHDRDLNAAINLRNVASSAMAACGGWGSGDKHKLGVTLRPKKQEVRSTYR